MESRLQKSIKDTKSLDDVNHRLRNDCEKSHLTSYKLYLK